MPADDREAEPPLPRQIALPQRLNADPEAAGRDLLKLVLALVDLIRQLLERQAIRRMDGGNLTEAEIERLGQAFLQMEAVLTQLKEQHGFTDADLNLDLGPLGRLL